METKTRDALIVGGGLAGLSAAVYLGRAMRDTLVIDHEKSLARWEPDVQNYLGFPKGISGTDLLKRGRAQAAHYQADIVNDEVLEAAREESGCFVLRGRNSTYRGRRLLIATGVFHLPPDVAGMADCVGQSVFFCKDCDGYRVQDQHIGVFGANNEAVRYALGMLLYSATVVVVTNGHEIHWDGRHAAWLAEYHIPVFTQRVRDIDHVDRQIRSITFEDGLRIELDVLFTTRGDIYHNQLAESLGARVSEAGEIIVDADQRTTVPGLYAAGCVTPANCQMIIAAGEGAVAAQAINCDLLNASLENHSLRRLRARQINTEQTVPDMTLEPV